MPSASKAKTSVLPTVLLILAVLAAGEIACRAWDAYDGYKKYNTLLSKTVIYRGQTYSISKPKNVKRVILLGGSAVHDTVKDFKESWPYLLEQKLRAQTGEKIEVINMGFYSESSIDELFKLNEFGLDLNPDLVIVFDGSNDVYNFYHHYDYHKHLYELKNKPIFYEKKRSFLTNFVGGIRKNSALYQRLKLMKRSATLKMSDLAEEGREQTPSSAAAESKPADEAPKPPAEDIFFEDISRWPEIRAGYLEMYKSNLDKMARLIQKGKAKGLFIFQPDLSYKPLLTESVTLAEKDQYLKAIGKHDYVWKKIQKETFADGTQTMKNIAKTYGITFYDFNPRILLGGDVHALFDGNVHFSPSGRERIASEISSIISEDKLL